MSLAGLGLEFGGSKINFDNPMQIETKQNSGGTVHTLKKAVMWRELADFYTI